MRNPYRPLLHLARLSLLLGSCYLAALVTGDLTRIWGPSTSHLAPLSTTSAGPRIDEAKLLTPMQVRLLASTTSKPSPTTNGPHQGQGSTKTKPPQHKRCAPNAPTKVSRLRWVLKGTAVAEPARYSSAAIYDHKRRKAVHLYVGQSYQGVLICSIAAKSIRISRGLGREELLIMGVSPHRLPRYRRPRFFSQRRRRRWRRKRSRKHRIDWRKRWRQKRWRRHYKQVLSSIKRHSRDHYAMPRRWLRPLARHYRFLQKQATILPYFQRGKAVGMRIIRPKSNSIFRKLGLQNGDIIRSVNGVPLSDPQRVIRAYYQLRGSSDFSVQIYRGGRHRVVRYSLSG